MMIDKEDLFLAETFALCCDFKDGRLKYCYYYDRFKKKKMAFHHLVMMYDSIIHKGMVVDHL